MLDAHMLDMLICWICSYVGYAHMLDMLICWICSYVGCSYVALDILTPCSLPLSMHTRCDS